MRYSTTGLDPALAHSDLDDLLARRTARFDQHLQVVVGGAVPVERYYQMMSYHLGWLDEKLQEATWRGGKRLRPALCMMACESVGAPAAHALPGAVAVELVHNFSLVHDDIEDGDELRRHRPTVWSLWGIPHGVNVGDGLLALAQTTLLEACAREGVTSAGVAAAAAIVLGRRSLELCEGQFLDMEFQELPSVGLPQYLSMVDRKTGALFGCAAEVGAILGAADAESALQLGRFGRVLGRAFQMQDDVFGVWGAESVTGKPAADVTRRKRGLPAVLAWERAAAADHDELRRLYAGPGPMTREAAARALAIFEELDVRAEALRMVTEQLGKAVELLPAALPEAATLPLRQLVALVAARFA
jgi:geranylgeranyl diphosphate synthase type I